MQFLGRYQCSIAVYASLTKKMDPEFSKSTKIIEVMCHLLMSFFDAGVRNFFRNRKSSKKRLPGVVLDVNPVLTLF